ncbi:hypothetical protein NEHOM01_0767, partial [Nematocida homosporus]|uniref:uncharacterized protein n=1 Tax=Nematocida homosporus TaxID=1912981 RepID=UPI00221EE646
MGALSLVPASIQQREIVCLGESLNDSRWVLPEPVKISLNHELLNFKIVSFEERYYTRFCQNIHYSFIEINGDKTPTPQYFRKCTLLLSRFQSITAHQLKISNVRDTNYYSNKFDLATFQRHSSPAITWALKVRRLVLDNVDIRIIYWMLGHYELAIPTEIHIINQKFANLAIAQILTHPAFNNITALVLNELLTLNEVILFDRREEVKEFLLFNYVDEKLK